MLRYSASQCFSSTGFGARYTIKIKDSMSINAALIVAKDFFESLGKYFIKSSIL